MNQVDYNSFESVNALADSLPYGHERTQLREKAINLADLSGNERQQFEVRRDFVDDVCSDGSFTEKYFTVFPWLLNYARQKGSDEDKLIVLWYYKWIVMVMPEFPAVTKQQMTATLEDLRKHYIDYGSNEKVFHEYAYELYSNIGEFEKARHHHEHWRRFKKRGEFDDCQACVANRNISFHLKLGTFQEAFQLAQPVLRGKIACTHVPKSTWANLLIPMIRNDKAWQAAVYASELYKKLIRSKFGGDNYDAHTAIIYYAHQGELARSIKLFEKFIKLDVEQKNLYRRFYFYTSILYLLNKTGKPTIKLKLPPKFALFNPSNTYDTALLKDWFNKETDAIAAAFDKRNGNSMISDEKKELLAV